MNQNNANIYVKNMAGETVKAIPVSLPCSERRLEKIMTGLLTNMNTESYYADDSEVEAAIRRKTK